MTGRKGPKEYLESLEVYHQKKLFVYTVWLPCLVIAYHLQGITFKWFLVTLIGCVDYSLVSAAGVKQLGQAKTTRGCRFSERPLEDTSLGIGQIPTFRALSQSPQWLENSTPLCFPVANEGFCWPPKKKMKASWWYPGILSGGSTPFV